MITTKIQQFQQRYDYNTDTTLTIKIQQLHQIQQIYNYYNKDTTITTTIQRLLTPMQRSQQRYNN